MGFNFKESAKKATTLSPIMNSRDKLSTEDIMDMYSDGITLIEFDIVESGDDIYAVFGVKEDDSKYYAGGMVLTKMAQDWVKEFHDSVEDASIALTKSGGVKVQIEKVAHKKIKDRTVTKVTVVE